MNTTEKRDVRVDFFRGIALYMILVDHVQADPISRFTYEHIGFSDAAELFVFLSGVSCAIVYSRLLARSGWAAALNAIAKRTAKIYGFYILTSAIIIAFIAGAEATTRANFEHDWQTALTADPLSSLWSAVLLRSPPALPGILVLYLMLTAIAMPIFLSLAQISPRLALLASCAIWMLAQLDPNLAPHFAEHSYFNWLAWQFLFCIGMFVGLQRQMPSPISPHVRAWVVRGSWAIVIGVLAYMISLKVLRYANFNVEEFRFSETTTVHMKENASALRLVHFLSVAVLVATYLKSDCWIFVNRASAIVITTGRFSLEVFCLTAIVDVLLNIWVLVDHPLTIERVLVDCAGLALIALLGTALAGRREHLRAIIDSSAKGGPH